MKWKGLFSAPFVNGINRIKASIYTLFLIFFTFSNASSQIPQLVAIETLNTSMIYTVDHQNRLVFQYYGKKLVNPAPFKVRAFLPVYNTSRTFSYEAYPGFGSGNVIEPAISAIHSDGSMNTELRFVSTTVKKLNQNISQTVICLKDTAYDFYVDLYSLAYLKEDVINQWVVIRNLEPKPVELINFFSSYLNFNASHYFLTHFQGPWANEMTMVEEELTSGIKSIESKKGVRTTQSENSAFILSLRNESTENEGECIAGALAWPGNYKVSFQVDEWRHLNVLGGINPFMSRYRLKSGDQLETPSMVYSFSSSGKGQLSRNLHDWARSYILPDGQTPRPIVLNSWEGAYFDFTETTLTNMMDAASLFGIEMFVLDDGWFGNDYPRNNAGQGLGDWQVNRAKLPRGLDYLTDYAASKGLKFGIWIEPEMVNPKSNLAFKHPDWVVQSPGREKPTIRNQWILDLSNPQVQHFVWNTIDEMLTAHPGISYIKWDANKHVENPGSTFLPEDEQTHFWIEYTKGLFFVYEKIREKYPNIILQACSSGGGRLDFGSLKFHHEFWASDNTDPLSRLFIQYGTNLIFPPIATASHVSASPNHQTGRITPLKFRFDVAMTGRLGMELQPADLKGEDSLLAVAAISAYKKIRPLVANGDLYRLISPYEPGGWTSLMYVSKDKSEAVLFVFSTETHPKAVQPTVKLNGLLPEATYKITEINAPKGRKLWASNQPITGDFLKNAGIDIPVSQLFDSSVLHIKKVNVK